jgi:hypothetical protein
MFKDIKYAHSQNRKKKTCHGDQTYMQQQHTNQHERQHPDYKRGSSKATSQYTSIIVATSRILGFHHGESESSQNKTFNKDSAKYNQ